MWAEKGLNLGEAKGMIQKAVDQEPKNAAYLDSLAWVMFKLGQPKEALQYMLQALEHSEEQDPTLYDHLGDIYAELKEDAKSHEAWQKSLALEPNPSVQKKLDAAKAARATPE
jgi:predicted Zn-dependent protease